MARRLKERRKETRSVMEMLLQSELHLSPEMWVFLLFSVADVVLTVKLLSHGGHVESNPVARFFLYSWGPKGLVYFKFALVAAVCVIAQIIALKRIEIARMVLSFALLAVGVVVAYSSGLYFRATF